MTMSNNYPETLINKYVWKQFEIAKPQIHSLYGTGASATVPFFPVNDIKAGDTAWGSKPYIIFDSFMRARSGNRTFYPIKTAQMIYSIKGKLSDIYEWRDFISNVLDREDSAASDLNEFIGGNVVGGTDIYFHSLSTNQVNYIGQSTTQSGQNKVFSADLIIRYDYHRTDIYDNH